MSWVNANGLRLHVQQLGRGEKTVIFLHGLVMDNLSSWYYTMANPVARDARVILYDLRGHGLSERPREGYTVADNVADLLGLLDALDIRHPVYLAGNSYGGLVSLAFTREYPERVAGLILVEAHFPVEGWGEQVAGTLEVGGVWVHKPSVLAWREANDKRHHRRRFAAAEDFIMKTSLIADLRDVPPYGREELSTISCPALAVYGEHSDVIERGHDLARWLPSCQLEVLSDAAHSILMDRTKEVRGHVLEWLEKQPAHGPAHEPANGIGD